MLRRIVVWVQKEQNSSIGSIKIIHRSLSLVQRVQSITNFLISHGHTLAVSTSNMVCQVSCPLKHPLCSFRDNLHLLMNGRLSISPAILENKRIDLTQNLFYSLYLGFILKTSRCQVKCWLDYIYDKIYKFCAKNRLSLFLSIRKCFKEDNYIVHDYLIDSSVWKERVD